MDTESANSADKQPEVERPDAHARHSFRENPFEYLAADYEISARDREEVQLGTAIILRGNVLEQLSAGAELAHGEIFFYLLAPAADPTVITDVLIPKQEAGYSSCRVDPREILKVNRQARERGMVIVAGAHSHKTMPSFTSGTDRYQHELLASEGVGRTTVCLVGGSSGQAKAVGTVNGNSGEPGPKLVELTFPESNVVVTVEVAGDVAAEHFRNIQLHRTQRRLITCFMTTNERREHLFPTLISQSCPTCGQQHGEMVPPQNTTVKVIGSTKELDEAERERIEQEIRDNVKSYSSCSRWGHRRYRDYDDYDDYDAGYCRDQDPRRDLPGSATECGDDHSTGLAVVPYKLYRRGQLVAEIDPALIEQAGATIEGFAQALGWRPASTAPSKKEERGDSASEFPCD